MLKKCNLKILLDQPGGRYRPGEAISGVVEIAPLDGVEAVTLTLSLHWQTDGGGDQAAGLRHGLTLFEGGLPPGRLQRFSFSFDAPDGPLTYHGDLLHVAWRLTAHADIPWARDATAEQEVVIAGSPATPLAALFPQMPLGDALDVLVEAEPETFQAALPAQQQLADFRRRGAVLLGYGKKVFYFFGGLMVVMGLAALITDPDAGLPLTLFGAVFLGFAHFIFRQFARFEAARTAPEEAQAVVEPALARPGETVRLTVRLREDARVTEATAVLQGEEHVTYERRTVENKTETESRVHLFFEQPAALQPTRRSAGAALQASFTLPPEAPCSFNAAHNALRWRIAFSLEIEGRDHPWHGSAPLVVRP